MDAQYIKFTGRLACGGQQTLHGKAPHRLQIRMSLPEMTTKSKRFFVRYGSDRFLFVPLPRAKDRGSYQCGTAFLDCLRALMTSHTLLAGRVWEFFHSKEGELIFFATRGA